MQDEYMLTTVDNPWNPFTHFSEWYVYDSLHGYHTLSYLARVVITSDDLSDVDQLKAIEDGIDEIVQENILGIYLKINRTTGDPKNREPVRT